MPAHPGISPNSPSKEYVYVGDRLVAIEEPMTSAPPPSVAAPTNLTATAGPGRLVELSWVAPANLPSGSTFQVERRQNGDPFTTIASNLPATSFTDSNLIATPITAYLYRVRAVSTSGAASAYSNMELATTVTFTDDVVKGTVIRAQQFTELRDAVNAVRRTAGLAEFTWTGPALQVRGLIYASHLNDLRTNLSDALAALGFPRPQYALPEPMARGEIVRAIHVNQLRELVK